MQATTPNANELVYSGGGGEGDVCARISGEDAFVANLKIENQPKLSKYEIKHKKSHIAKTPS